MSFKLLGGGALSGNVCYQRRQWEHLAPVPGIPFTSVPGIFLLYIPLCSAGLPKKEDVFHKKKGKIFRCVSLKLLGGGAL
ncbi:MAG: hypothetical protein F6K48_27780 [Okeania sp. SIO3H1]|uniref:hypothetical protein n=1 Tax=Okeania sp. SIO1I7 TaxID=2607772 RepID=UPI0013C67D6B|nr:hypothetical protein [Okeania sp. SIO1I7]NEN92495.1 hypothetical protein [Okeania sp. SIO3H1]NET24070.1 hypothetical protein [Okeania sp. SIO1I7]